MRTLYHVPLVSVLTGFHCTCTVAPTNMRLYYETHLMIASQNLVPIFDICSLSLYVNTQIYCLLCTHCKHTCKLLLVKSCIKCAGEKNIFECLYINVN